jgi:multidrug resistance efflux pump
MAIKYDWNETRTPTEAEVAEAQAEVAKCRAAVDAAQDAALHAAETGTDDEADKAESVHHAWAALYRANGVLMRMTIARQRPSFT